MRHPSICTTTTTVSEETTGEPGHPSSWDSNKGTLPTTRRGVVAEEWQIGASELSSSGCGNVATHRRTSGDHQGTLMEPCPAVRNKEHNPQVSTEAHGEPGLLPPGSREAGSEQYLRKPAEAKDFSKI